LPPLSSPLASPFLPFTPTASSKMQLWLLEVRRSELATRTTPCILSGRSLFWSACLCRNTVIYLTCFFTMMLNRTAASDTICLARPLLFILIGNTRSDSSENILLMWEYKERFGWEKIVNVRNENN
jgi:hypothetical protein